MTAIRVLSDLHTEFCDFELPLLDTDKDDVLVLAGDIALIERPSTFVRVKEWASLNRFKRIIHINGNHEFYGGSLIRGPAKLKEIFSSFDNIDVAMNNKVVRVDNISFICATLWTNYNSGNPVIMQLVQNALNDYNHIRTGHYDAPYKRKVTPRDLFSEHVTSKHFIFENVVIEKAAGQKVVVVSHHAPSRKSIHPRFGDDPVNWGYVSELDLEIMDTKPDLWLHGHVHNSFDYMVGDTRVITNPRGYTRIYNGKQYSENSEFNPNVRIEV